MIRNRYARTATLAAAAALMAWAAAPCDAATLFAVAYRGAGSYRTVYHSEPPNPGGRHDVNDAVDSSTQRWALRFSHQVLLPPRTSRRRCGPAACVAPNALAATLTGATGATEIDGRIAHVHRDGLYRSLDGEIHCRIRSATTAGDTSSATIRFRYSARTDTIAITAFDPVSDALALMPAQCPGQGDSIDGLADNYLTPGFSFASGYGADRWFTSGTVVVKASRLRRARRWQIALRPSRTGAPPRGCAVSHRAYERCSTGGAWSGVLTLTAIG